jgi:hypothetical protein
VIQESSPAVLGALAAGAWFGLFVGSHLLVLHLWSPASRARVLVVSYAICCIGVTVTVRMLAGNAAGWFLSAVFGLMTVSCLLVLYVPLYYVVSNSLSVQSMILLLNSHGSLTREELSRKFASHEFLEARVRTLVRSGHVMEDGATFRISQRGRSIVAPFLMLKSLWRLGAGG